MKEEITDTEKNSERNNAPVHETIGNPLAEAISAQFSSNDSSITVPRVRMWFTQILIPTCKEISNDVSINCSPCTKKPKTRKRIIRFLPHGRFSPSPSVHAHRGSEHSSQQKQEESVRRRNPKLQCTVQLYVGIYRNNVSVQSVNRIQNLHLQQYLHQASKFYACTSISCK